MARALPLVSDYDFDEEAHGFGEPEETPAPPQSGLPEKLALAAVGVGLVSLLAQLGELLARSRELELDWLPAFAGSWPGFLSSYVLLGVAASLYFYFAYRDTHPGIKHDGVFFSGVTGRGALAWIAGIGLTGFYVLLYWNAEYLTFAIRLCDPLSLWFTGEPANQWFLYGLLYTALVLAFGVRAIMKYRHNRYQIVRTLSVMFFQLGFAFLLPQVLKRFYAFEAYPSYFWPLDYDALFPSHVSDLWNNKGHLGTFMLFWGLVMTFVMTPVLTYFYGKRWYCSWVCGCGGLAETLGDGYRQLSDTSTASWSYERGMIYTVLGFIALTTGLLWAHVQGWLPSAAHVNLHVIALVLGGLGVAVLLLLVTKVEGDWRTKGTSARGVAYLLATVVALTLAFEGWLLYQEQAHGFVATVTLGTALGYLAKLYGFAIGAAFSGVIGVGFYPLLGSRVWCRFGCPMAATLGILQRFFSRFRITTNGGQCISCGNCSTYCEMGIDVRDYAQRGENIVRASCVGCGVCAAVCPRGVLKLENGPPAERWLNQRPEMAPTARALPTASEGAKE